MTELRQEGVGRKMLPKAGFIWAALGWFLPAMLLSLWNVAGLFSQSARMQLLELILSQEIKDPATVSAWFRIHGGLTVWTAVCAWIVGLGLTVSMVDVHRGTGFLAAAVKLLRTALRIIRGLLIGLFIFKFVRYSVWCLGINGGIMLFFSMALFEGILFSLAMLSMGWLIRFLERAADSADAVQFTMCSGEPDASGIHPGAVTGLRVLIGVQLLGALIYGWNPAVCAMELCLAAGYFMLSLWLRRYKSVMEWQALKPIR